MENLTADEIARSVSKNYDTGKVIEGLSLYDAVLDAVTVAAAVECKECKRMDQELRELQYLFEVERGRRAHLHNAIVEVLKHTAKACREEWGREQVDFYLREQLATTPPLPDKRILAGGAEPIDWHALADQYARDVLGWQAQSYRLAEVLRMVVQAETLDQITDVKDAAQNALGRLRPGI